ncbi:alpha/beta fold hydrolase [Rubrobacter tropicus]|uniref:Alpha/beta fold hydrolase n=1 Tax=Rubrobacter tropicus TaxID=2653851 RepID=A0A6G8Q4E0_9ACTN|nr:alpha/beta fold hydrolase [Rubrobacter tropicus]QIN81308.1 alpha/beta fold hydrolase [Rubrobacter tropicus]
MPRTTGTAETNGATLYYEISGSGEPLVLVHAGIADGRMWGPQMDAFSSHYRTIRHDMRGFGRSRMVEGPYSHHADLCALLDALNVGRASFVGCSQGGGAVIDFALENPERVEALVLVGPAVSGFEFDEGPPEEWDELVAADEAGDLQRVSELEVRMWVDGPRRGPDVVDPAVRDLVREMNEIALKNEALEIGEELPLKPPAATRLSQIQAPTLVLIGDEDRPRPLAAADLLTKNLPNARKAVLPGTAHLPNMETPDEFNTLVLDFLKS